MRQMSVISGHPIFIGFRRLTGCQLDPRDRGVTFLITLLPCLSCLPQVVELSPRKRHKRHREGQFTTLIQECIKKN